MADLKTQSPPPSPDQPVPAEFDLICEECGYSLVGLIHSNRCPECGEYFDPNALPLARVPWLYRRRMGWWSTYVDTVVLILKSPRAFAVDLCRPVRINAEDAGRFRAATGWITSMTVLVVGSIIALLFLAEGRRSGLIGVPMAVGAFAGTRFFVQFATDIPTFIWRGPNRANPHELSPLQHYASAPLVLLAIPGALAASVPIVGEILPVSQMDIVLLMEITAGMMVAMLLIAFLSITVIFMRVATNCSIGRAIALALYLPVHWCLMAIIAWIFAMIVFVLVALVGGKLLELFGLLPY